MSTKLILYFNTEQGKTYSLSVPHNKRAGLLTEQTIANNMDKIIASNAIETLYGDLSSKKKAVIKETTYVNIIE